VAARTAAEDFKDMIKRVIYMAFCEFIELALIYRRTRQLHKTADSIEARIKETRNYRDREIPRWN
jgi:hypothetical protein